MAVAEPSGLTFVDEDDLPVAFLRIAHVDSDNEAPSDVDSSEGESADESGEAMSARILRSVTTQI